MLRKKLNATPPKPPRLMQVAAYARVSCGKDAMLESLSAQVSYYSKLIQEHPGWQFAGVYADEALTGTNTSKSSHRLVMESTSQCVKKPSHPYQFRLWSCKHYFQRI